MKLLKSLATLFLFFFSITSIAEETTNGMAATQYSDACMVSNMKITSSKAPVQDSIGGSSYNVGFYRQGKALIVSGFEGNYVKVKYVAKDDNQFEEGWIHRKHFGYQQMQTIQNACSAQKNRATYASRGTRPENTGSLNNSTVAGAKNIPAEIAADYAKLKEFYKAKNRREKYTFINKPNGYKMTTYLVDMQTGKFIEKFDSLRGYNGYGCGTGQTRPGIYRLHSASGRGASRKPWWGNNHKYQVMQNIGGSSKEWGGNGCGIYYQHVAHSNKHMKGSSSKGRRFSAGCFVTSPEKFTQWTETLAGNALIFNSVKNPATY